MSKTIRVFVAVELPPKVRNALADLIEQLKDTQIPGLRLVRPEGIHLTLKFLGDVPKSQVESIVAAVSQAAQASKAFALELGQPGVFPNRNASRVLWVGIGGDLSPLLALHQQVEVALATLGFAEDRRGFNPHLTVARIRDGSSKADRQRAAEAIFSTRVQPGLHIEVDSISLMQSTLLPDGAVYESIASMPIEGRFRNGSS